MKLLWGIFLLAIVITISNACDNSCCYTSIKISCCICRRREYPTPTTTTTIRPGQIPPHVDTKPCSSSSNNTCNSNVTLTNQLNITNTISNKNTIHVPIHITNTNIHSVNRLPSREKIVESTTPSSTTSRTTSPTTTTSTTSTTPTTRSNCCVILVPLRPSVRTCGPRCITPVVYIPYNPCPNYGCFRRNVWTRNVCGQSGCHPIRQDCSNCNSNFYQNFQSYQSCYGCFSSVSGGYGYGSGGYGYGSGGYGYGGSGGVYGGGDIYGRGYDYI